MFNHPFTCLVCGPTSSGKTTWVENLLANHHLIINGLPSKDNVRVLWFYGQEYESIKFKSIKNCTVIYHRGIPDLAIINTHTPSIVIIDDLMDEGASSSFVSALFTRGSHHGGMSILFMTQNIFHGGKQMRNISLNAHYIVLMRNRRDQQQIAALGRQLFPTGFKDFVKAYIDATKEPFGYLVIDTSPKSDVKLMLRSNIFPQQAKSGNTYILEPIVYLVS